MRLLPHTDAGPLLRCLSIHWRALDLGIHFLSSWCFKLAHSHDQGDWLKNWAKIITLWQFVFLHFPTPQSLQQPLRSLTFPSVTLLPWQRYEKKKKSHGKSNPLSSYPNLDGQPGGGQGRTPNWVLQFLSQPCFRELGPTFSKSSSFSVLRSSGGESTDTFSCLSLCTVK